MKKILHIFPDDKFFDSVSTFFDLIPNIRNEYVYLCSKDYQFKYIKLISKIKCIYEYEEYTNFIKGTDADIIYLHSLNDWEMFKYIPSNKKIIWWSWGYDIYEPTTFFTKPILNISLYKKKTTELLKREQQLSAKFISLLKAPYYWYMKKVVNNRISKILNRIDYYTPVLPIEYDLLMGRKDFHAKPFCLESGPGINRSLNFSYHENAETILIGNSYTPTNNHLDIFEIIKTINVGDRKILIPINYGSGYPLPPNDFKSKFTFNDNIIWLDKFIDYEEYVKLQTYVTHAIFGFLRQQGFGNIQICLSQGVKIFLYKTSLEIGRAHV